MSHKSHVQAELTSSTHRAKVRMAKRMRYDFITDSGFQTVRDASNSFSDTFHSSIESCVHGEDELK